jgi:methionyl-tRNA synthetase
MASGLPLPKKLLVHGWITVGDQKMSKSLGNVVDPMALYEQYGAEPVRYYLMRKMAITHDSSFSIEDLEQTITADLANDLGNLLNRMTTLAHAYNTIELPMQSIWSNAACDLRDECLNALQETTAYMHEYLYHRALARLWKFIHATNTFFHAHEPWKLAKSDHAAFVQVLSATTHSLHTIAVMLWPIMPTKMATLLDSLGVHFNPGNHTIETLELGLWRQSFMLKKIDPLFAKPEPRKESERQPEATVQTSQAAHITIDDFAKVQLLVGTITTCTPAPTSNKMLILQVDFGVHGTRTILSGVAQSFTPEQLIGKQGVFVCNLAPRKMLGMESQGMMLFAKDDTGKMTMATVADGIANGTKLA